MLFKLNSLKFSTLPPPPLKTPMVEGENPKMSKSNLDYPNHILYQNALEKSSSF